MKSEIEIFVIAKIRTIRRKKGISQAGLAELLNVSVGFIGQVEIPGNDAKYNLNHLNKLAKIFDCPMADFFPEEYLPVKNNEYRQSSEST